MQNFTLGKKGISMLFFALILLIGSLPSYGQCPTDSGTDQDQTFCYLATVGDIVSDGATVSESADKAVYQTANNTTDTQPLPNSQILDNNATYYVGGQSGTCERRAVTVSLNTVPYPNNTLFPNQSSFTISPCSGDFTAGDLASYFTPLNSDYSIIVYSQEFGMNSVDNSTTLTPNMSYFVGQISSTSCPSFRVAVGYDPEPVNAPTAQSLQTFCEGATVADLEAQGTYPNTQAIRWYSRSDSFQPLPSNTILLDGEDYFASQVVNDRNNPLPPCESADRTRVVVAIDAATLNETTQSFCASIGTGNDFRMPQVQDLAPQGGTFYAESNSDLPLDPTTELEVGEDYFNRATGDDCTQDRITVQFFDTPNAGSTTFTSACTNDPSFDLVSRIEDSQLGAPQTTGFFTPALASGTNIFTPQDYVAGSYTFTYTIQGNANCPTDTSVITVDVQQAPNAGPDQTITFCQSEIETLVNLAQSDPTAAQAILTQRITNADLTGNFGNTDLQNIALGYLQAVNTNNFPFNAAAVYTVDNGNCQDSSNIQVVVNESPYAGDDTNIEVNSTQEPFNLYDVLVENSSMTPDTGGEFAPGNLNGDFNPATASSGTYTYTVRNEFGCTDTASINVTVLIDLGCPEVTETPQSFCESISDADGNNPRRPRVSDLSPMEATWYASADSDTPIPGNTILVDGNVYFAGNTNGTCNNRMPVRVNIDPAPNAGATTILNVCSADAPFNISSRMNPSILGAADAGGSITPALTSGTDLFDPAVDNAGRYTYRVASANSGCEDDIAIVTINITDPVVANAGADVSLTFCSTDGIQDLNTKLGANAYPGGSFSGLTNGLFDPSTATIGVNTITYTVDNSIACVTGTSEATYTINVTQGPNAGQDGTVTFSNMQQGTYNLFTYLQGNPTAGGSWNPGNVDGSFTPEGKAIGTYVFTYTVNNSNNCSDSANVTVTITDDMVTCPEITDTTQEFCESISDADGNNPRRPQVRDLLPMNITWYATVNSTEALAPTAVLLDNQDYFAGNANGDCPNREKVNVQIGKAPNAGATTNITACRNDAPFDIVGRLNPSLLGTAMPGGTITPAFASGTTVFNPAVDAGRQYKYTVQSEFGKCDDDFTFINITVNAPVAANAGVDVNLTFCSTDGSQNLFNSLPTGINPNGSFEGLTDGIFNPATASIGNNTITYTINSEDGCFTGSDSSSFIINILQGPNAGEDGSVTFSNLQEGTFNLFAYLQGNPATGGSWNPGNADGTFTPQGKEVGTYEFIYTVTNDNDCSDIATVTVTITDQIITCPEIADSTQEFCETISDEDGNNPRRPQVRDLLPTNATWYATATSTDALAPTTVLVNGDYFAGNPDATCTTRGRVDVIIDESPNAGANTVITVCSDEEAFDIVTRLNESILGAADAGGTLSPAFVSGTTIFDPSVDVARQYTYRVSSENSACPDDTTLVTIVINDPVAANAGGDIALNFCSNEDVQNLYDFIGTDGNTQGSFGDLTDGLFNPSENVGTTTFTYTVDDSVGCAIGTDTATFTITVTEPQTANAGDDISAAYCVDQTEDVDLRSLLPEAIRNRGSFSAPYQDGTFNPSAAGEGVVTITYAINGAEDCAIGTDEASITITVNGVSEAPVADAEQTFCFINNPTVADLSANGTNVIWYEDADLTVVAESTDPLVTGEDYYAVATADENSCGSAAVMVNVTINDSDAPTLQFEGNEFCRQDNPTVQDLVDNVTGGSVKIYTAATGGTAVTTSTTLVNGTTYYASSTDSTFGCESTERLAIVAKVGFCGIPEGFSPNGDSINDRFVIPDIAIDYPNYTIEIFNRWGQTVFEGNTSTGDWDGVSNRDTTLGNDVLPVGVYFYILKYNDGVTAPVQGKLYLSR